MNLTTRLFLLAAGLLFCCASLAEGTASEEKKNLFNIAEYQVSGNTLLPAIRIEEAVYRYLGDGKTIADVEKARGALEKAYHDAGYLTVLVDIPEQSVSSGIVQLKVTEGSVEKIRVEGARYFSLGRLMSKVPELAEGNVPYFPDLQTQMVDANHTADMKVAPVLRPGKTPGKVEAELKVDDQLPLHGSLEYNNHASASTSLQRLIALLRYDNLWQREHSLSLQYQTTPARPGEVRVASATYLMPLEHSDNQLAFYAVASRSNVAVLGDMSVLGQGNIYGVRWVIPLPAREQLFHTLTLGVDYKDFVDDTILAGANTGHTPIRYLPFSVSYGANITGESGVTGVNAALNFHLRGVGDRMTDCNGQLVSEFECKRYDAKADFFYLRGDVQHTVSLARSSEFYVKVGGQMTSGPLISNEQFVAGGADSVRGYYESEQAGDDGARATVELRSPQWQPGPFNELRLLAFYDSAHLRVREALPAQTDTFNLASAGLGLRAQAWKSVTLGVDVAWPRKDTNFTEAGKTRVGFKVVGAF